MSLRTRSIGRSLMVRLALASVLLSALLGGAAFFNEWRQLDGRIVERTQLSVELLKSEMGHLLGNGASERPVQEALEHIARSLPKSEMGRFAFVAIHDAQRRELARLTDPESAVAPRLVEALEHQGFRFPENQPEIGKPLDIAPTPDLPLALLIADAQGKTIGYVNGVFVLSPEAATELRWSALRAAGLVIAVVLATALLLYPVIRGLVARLGALTIRLLDANIDTIKTLGSAIAKRDSDTDAHNYRVTVYSVRLAEALGLEGKTIRTLIKGAFLHDVGKIGIRDHILLKPGKLDEAEFAIMRQHVLHGLDIVRRAAWLGDAAEVVGGHHEKYDGSGYPRGLRGDSIPVTARIFAIADVFDALTSERPYKKAFGLDEALAILRQSAGSHFDPKLVACFEAMAPALFAAFANRDEEARHELGKIAQQYYQGDLGEILDEAEEATPASASFGGKEGDAKG